MKNFDTGCVHPLKSELYNSAVTAGIQPAVSYEYIGHDNLQYPGFYSTYNQQRLGQIICNMEQGTWGMVFSSGMAAISTAILSFLNNGAHIIFSKDLYGGTLKFANEELPKRGIACSFAGDVEGFKNLIRSNTKIMYIETPSNPLLNILPLEEIADVAKTNNIITIIDNTFASPINQLPLLHGFDIVVHSGTKYLGGHNDLPYGALVSGSHDNKEVIFDTAKMYGGSLTPYECYLAERSLKTLSLRIKKQNGNAFVIAEYLKGHASVESVYYPGLSAHPQHNIAKQQMSGFGGMLSFELKTGVESITAFQQKLQLVRPALSLGGVESLMCAPAVTSHRYLSKEERLAIGIKDNLLRLSVGIEDANDIIEDMQQAMRQVSL
ncbi:trans-sulfuration enzyme family protein [Parafilimonas sp.]|uniref:trans-sulfuration enzyme family protein n=1 Tax=Parafilimonas sp. TaxID=1969739 RepID=UPI0039E55670